MEDVLRLFVRGGPSMYAIAATAALGLGLFVERFLTVRGLIPDARRLGERVRDACTAGDMPAVAALCAEAKHGLAPILGKGVELAMRDADRDHIFDVMARESRRHARRVRRGLGLLATLGTMAPFLGLLGTVLGIMQALRDIGRTGTAGFDVVSIGVAEALITTAAGIVVAVVIVLLHQSLKSQLGSAILEVQLLVEEVADYLVRGRPTAPQGDSDGAE